MKKVKILSVIMAAFLMLSAVSCNGDAIQSQASSSELSSAGSASTEISSTEVISSQDESEASREENLSSDIQSDSDIESTAAQSDVSTGSESSASTESKSQTSTTTSTVSKPNTSTTTSTVSKPQTSTTASTVSKPQTSSTVSTESNPDEGPQIFGETFTEGDDNFSATDLTTAYSSEDTSIKLNGNTVKISGSGASFADKRISITSPGTYVFSGTLSDGQIYVNVSKEEKVQLVFNGVNITNTTTSCVYVDSCDKTVITLAEGSKNTLTDCSAYIFPSPSKTKPNACIFSDDDLTINGSGSLTVNAKYNNGIGTDNDLTIVGSTIKVSAVNNALKGDYSFTCKDANITIISDGDGIKVDDDYRKDKGYIYIESGNFNITAADDAIQAVTSITILSGTKIISDCDGDTLNCGETGVISVPNGVITEK